MNKIVFFGGKGGVGKTTCSSSFALSCANKGMKTLLVSTDPAHSISDIFETKIGYKIVNIRENLDALEISSEIECKNYMNRVKANLKNVVSPVIVKEIKKQIDAAAISPGTEEAALFDKMIEIIIDKSEEYDKIIFDTAPTGHTVRLMSLPELLGAWLNSLILKRKKALELMQMAQNAGKKNKDEIENDAVIKILKKRYDNMQKARAIITDNDKLSFVFVLNAEKLPIEETKKAVNILDKYKIKVDSLIVNRILPDDIKDEFWINKKELEKKYIDEIYETFKGKKIIKIPMLKQDMRANNIKELMVYFEDESRLS
ncbi:arsenical pump-driving ATPase [Clostridium tepidiprofundi DSM 19306]|uniref:Arsenical pump-driving ATPase n=1 Tax=Clostridium tepidiprofundi DSM 19306 TaxID=1121338 RepID=A0A151B6C2_9CLOT|nr:TRC40/GET3/ArsA family transport-energizing ATPase [Clostridium tepidiprofundi]KYH35456.1 arsenical pump-driving ATPase [Clostridium tepidiprofundi DSM 19306]